MLELYRTALRLRRREPALGEGDLSWFDTPDGSIGFTREPGFACIANVSAAPFEAPTGWSVRVASGPLLDGVGLAIPADTTVWLRC
jgi:alpha-glucosidase